MLGFMAYTHGNNPRFQFLLYEQRRHQTTTEKVGSWWLKSAFTVSDGSIFYT
jgi:hypothetical protein